MDKTDSELKNDVLCELNYEPSVKVTDIGVLVKDGTVTLNGFASSYWEKWDAVRAAKRVAGVSAIADDIEVKLPGSLKRSDSDIASAALLQIEWAPGDLRDTLMVTVREGWITLEGNVEWWYQKNAAENAVQHIAGVRGVSNMIVIEPRLSSANVSSDIVSAFKRSAVLDAEKIKVEAKGNKVTLRGTVRNHSEEEEAERTAWAAPGVLSVDNQLTVNWSAFVS